MFDKIILSIGEQLNNLARSFTVPVINPPKNEIGRTQNNINIEATKPAVNNRYNMNYGNIASQDIALQEFPKDNRQNINRSIDKRDTNENDSNKVRFN